MHKFKQMYMALSLDFVYIPLEYLYLYDQFSNIVLLIIYHMIHFKKSIHFDTETELCKIIHIDCVSVIVNLYVMVN